MKKQRIIVRTVFYLLIAAMAGCIVAACCLLGRHPVLSYCLFGGAGAALLAQFFVALGIRLGPKRKIGGFRQWLTSWEVVVVILAFVVLSPLLLIIYVLDALFRRPRTRNAANNDGKVDP